MGGSKVAPEGQTSNPARSNYPSVMRTISHPIGLIDGIGRNGHQSCSTNGGRQERLR